MKTAVIQFNAGKDKAKNIARALDYVQQAADKGARFILLPEVFSYRGEIKSARELSELAERIPGPSVKPFQELARRCRVFLQPGSFYEQSRAPEKVYNTAVLIDSQGKIIARYRKRHLFHARLRPSTVREADLFLPGRRGAMARVRSFTIGMSICYDLRFPQLYQGYARRQAEVLTVPSAFTHETGKAHWEALLRARAIENLCYVLAPNQIGKSGRGIRNYGNSMIIDPWGRILARAGSSQEEILYAKLDKAVIRQQRKILPKPF